MLVCASMIDKQNLSGNIKQVTGVITEIENDDVIKIVLKEDNIQKRLQRSMGRYRKR